MTDNAAPFSKMASRIELNKDEGFGGAFVVVPPGGDESKPFDTLILDGTSGPAAFWALLKSKCDMALADIEAAERNKNAGFGRR